MAKIYLSAAAHGTDNRTQCSVSCSENTHCNQYMDKVEEGLRAQGFEVMRGNPSLTGSIAMKTRTSEANKWKADLYYVAHTNAGGGRYSMTMYYPGTKGQTWANTLHSYRKCINHKLKSNTGLYEINQTSMPCLYDELFFHDNAEDCNWFHNGGMDAMATETVKAFCEIFGVSYKEDGNSDVDNNEETITTTETCDVTYQVWDDVRNAWLPNIVNKKDYAGIFGHDVCAVYANLSKGNIIYKVHVKGGSWLPEVTNRADYAGIFNKPIDGLAMKTDNGHKLHYQVHLRRSKKWLDDISGYNTNNSSTGFAGVLGQEIDAIYVWCDPITKTTVIKKDPVTMPPVQEEPKKEEQPQQTATEIYRIRKSKDNASSQVGAYKNLQSAIKKCQEAGEGYSVFDSQGNVVYTYVKETVVEPTPEPIPEPIPEPTPEPTPEPEPDEPNNDEEVTDSVFLKALKAFIQLLLKWLKIK